LYDNIQVAQGIVEYNFDTGEKENRVLDSVVSIITIKIPKNAKFFNFTIFAEDTSNNTIFKNNSLPVLDNDPPGFLDFSEQRGDNFEFLVSTIDNINVSTVKLRYWLKDGLVKTLVLVVDTGTCYESINLTTQDKKIYYVIEVEDISGNTVISDEVYIDLIWPDNKVIETTDTNEYQFGIIILLFIILFLIIAIISVILIRKSWKTTSKDYELETLYETSEPEHLPESIPKSEPDQEPEIDSEPIEEDSILENHAVEPTKDTKQDDINTPDSQNIPEELVDEFALEVEPVQTEPDNSYLETLVEKSPKEEENIQNKEEQIITDLKPEQAEQTITNENIQSIDQTKAIPVVEESGDVIAKTHVAPLAKLVDNNRGNNSGEN
jgi:hypothetical protein